MSLDQVRTLQLSGLHLTGLHIKNLLSFGVGAVTTSFQSAESLVRSPNVNCFVGPSGEGKTSVLRVIDVGLQFLWSTHAALLTAVDSSECVTTVKDKAHGRFGLKASFALSDEENEKLINFASDKEHIDARRVELGLTFSATTADGKTGSLILHVLREASQGAPWVVSFSVPREWLPLKQNEKEQKETLSALVAAVCRSFSYVPQDHGRSDPCYIRPRICVSESKNPCEVDFPNMCLRDRHPWLVTWESLSKADAIDVAVEAFEVLEHVSHLSYARSASVPGPSANAPYIRVLNPIDGKSFARCDPSDLKVKPVVVANAPQSPSIAPQEKRPVSFAQAAATTSPSQKKKSSSSPGQPNSPKPSPAQQQPAHLRFAASEFSGGQKDCLMTVLGLFGVRRTDSSDAVAQENHHPLIVLLDEPGQNLGAFERSVLRRFISERARRDVQVFLVTHHVEMLDTVSLPDRMFSVARRLGRGSWNRVETKTSIVPICRDRSIFEVEDVLFYRFCRRVEILPFFFARGVILVEGRSDCNILHALDSCLQSFSSSDFAQLNLPPSHSIGAWHGLRWMIFDCFGCHSQAFVKSACDRLGIPCIMILDSEVVMGYPKKGGHVSLVKKLMGFEEMMAEMLIRYRCLNHLSSENTKEFTIAYPTIASLFGKEQLSSFLKDVRSTPLSDLDTILQELSMNEAPPTNAQMEGSSMELREKPIRLLPDAHLRAKFLNECQQMFMKNGYASRFYSSFMSVHRKAQQSLDGGDFNAFMKAFDDLIETLFKWSGNQMFVWPYWIADIEGLLVNKRIWDIPSALPNCPTAKYEADVAKSVGNTGCSHGIFSGLWKSVLEEIVGTSSGAKSELHSFSVSEYCMRFHDFKDHLSPTAYIANERSVYTRHIPPVHEILRLFIMRMMEAKAAMVQASD
eukprot:ANDGO_01337.mRNA.1 hypothetical protein